MPSDGKSSFLLRMIRLDKKALLRDMLLSKEADVYVEYENSGKVDGSNGRFLVEPKYSVKVSSWGGREERKERLGRSDNIVTYII
jgi:hypothetical protein